MNFSVLMTTIFEAITNISFIEWLIFGTALFYVVLAAIENVWCWFFGIISSILSIYLCYSSQLFLESGLQVFYVFVGFYGWYEWLHGSPEKSNLSIQTSSIKQLAIYIFISCILWIPFGAIAKHYSTQVLPYLDAFITSFSIVATWMVAKKKIENWLFWILIDAAAIILYAKRDFYLIAFLYLIYTILAGLGYLSWKKKLNA
ncbi:MAG: nicotinamide mononucleotide transporter [Bacteroidetes bacterium]|nr:nicotinamide mononucleotide transporter [Bacteroidota bacterium]